jgi:NADH-quinone oxidoreductase subunit G
VRFTREISGGGELMVVDRGSHAEIDVFPGFPLENALSGNVNDLCPVGALCSKDFLYQQRVWFMQAHDSVCTRCSAGCSTQLHVSHGHLYRVQPRYNPNANQWWMCDLGRFENGYVRAPERLSSIKQRTAERFEDLLWSDGVARIRQELLAAARSDQGARLAFVLSPCLTCEEAFLLAQFARQVAPKAALYLGKVPVAGADQTFKSGFTIRAERCPNRLGVSQVLLHFQPELLDWPRFVDRASLGALDAAYVTANYPEPWIEAAEVSQIGNVPLLIVQDLLPTPLARAARFVVPGASFAEKAGSYVNHAGLLQSTQWALRPP